METSVTEENFEYYLVDREARIKFLSRSISSKRLFCPAAEDPVEDPLKTLQ